MDEINYILQHLMDELKGVQDYMTHYHETDEGIFKDIAHEEMSHAKVLKCLYMHHGGIEDPFIEEWKNAEEAMKD